MLNRGYREAFDSLTDEQAGKMIKAVFAYDAGEDVSLEPELTTAWLFVRAGLDDEKKAMEEVSAVNAENGRRGGRPKKQEQEPDEPRRRNDYPDGFNAFWNAYPRKKGKAEAYAKYQARLNDGYSPDEIVTAAKAYAQECVRERTEEKYIKLPKTFLGPATPFVDYLRTGEPDNSGYGEVDFASLIGGQSYDDQGED